MKPGRAGIFGFGLLAFAGSAGAAESLCAATERVFFNCPIKDGPKLLSVCGRTGEYLQYRFGPRDKPELAFPMEGGGFEKFQAGKQSSLPRSTTAINCASSPGPPNTVSMPSPSRTALHDTPEIVEMESGAAESPGKKPRHGSLTRARKAAGRQAAWAYTPARGFIGNDGAEFVVRGRATSGEAVEFRLRYKLRVTPEKLRAYIPQPDPPMLSVPRTHCLIPAILLDYSQKRGSVP